MKAKSALKLQAKIVIRDFEVSIFLEMLFKNLDALSYKFQERRVQMTKGCQPLDAHKSKWPLIFTSCQGISSCH